LYIEKEHIKAIVDGCAREDRKMQEQLYKGFYDAMMNICARYTKSDTDAKTVLNNGFLKVFNNIHQYNATRASIYTWIRAIMINCCIDYMNLKQNTIELSEIPKDSDFPTEADINKKINANEILELIKKLPPATLAVFNLYVVDDYSYKEIAGLLKISLGTVKWHLNEARKSLKQQVIEKKII